MLIFIILTSMNKVWQSSKLKRVVLISAVVAALTGIAVMVEKITPKNNFADILETVIKPASAKEIYPLFFCPCCGQPLDKNNICCEAAKERIDYIDSLITEDKSEEEIILGFVKKYGLNSFVDKNKGKEFKEKLISQASADRPIIFLSPETYDFGDVSQKTGKVYTYFDLKNEGKSDLIIDRLETSCGCTFVSVVFQYKESPFFTMPGHGYENPQWEGVTIPSGETAQLKVMYDPDVHLDFRGFAIREIYVFSNDPIDFEKKVQVELNQVE